MIDTLFGIEPVRGIIPRDYQGIDVCESFRLWDSGTIGALTRCFTGGGKTIMTCLKFEKWLARGPDNKCMVLNFEQELVHQFAREIQDVLGIAPSIEMGNLEIDSNNIPQIVVASRQSLMTHELATQEQREELAKFGFSDIGLLTKSAARRAIRSLRDGVDEQLIGDAIAEHNADYRCNHELGRVSRLYKFDWKYNWLVVMDEAHRYSMKLKTVGHVVEWFEKNPNHRRSGITATPKRRDKVSIGSKLFPGIALDYPLTKAIQEGYAVPYIQKFVQVESIDFRRLKELCGTDQEKWDNELDRLLNTEEELAKLCEPMLDMVGDRKTLIFSPSVSMAQNVADYINARSEAECPSCASRRWYPTLLLGDGAKCRECGDFISTANVTKSGIQAHCVHGSIPHKSRTEVYRGHKSDTFQFLSVCGLCREGYNDPDISCVAIFRPVSKAASSLQEQMKGRGGRTERGCIDGLQTALERLAAIAKSGKQNCLVVDLVGVTGLADCASTIQIFAEGLPDAIVARAEEIALFGGVDDPLAAIEQAKREDEEEKERMRLEREAEAERRRKEAEKRAKLDAEVTYTTHEVGTARTDPKMASDGQVKYIRFLGLELRGWEPTKKQAGRMLNQLIEEKMPPEEVAYQNGIPEGSWCLSHASLPQARLLARHGIKGEKLTPKAAHELIEMIKNGRSVIVSPTAEAGKRIESSETAWQLDDAGRYVRDLFATKRITPDEYQTLVAKGRAKRTEVF